MENFYLALILLLFLLAIVDLIVGVSNDAINFLNSAIGSKAAPMKIILGVAGIGVMVGVLFSNGMMEVARDGIFNPSLFYFNEIIFIFLAVLLTDILLLDFFNALGIPTSTTVSVIFELFGAAVGIILIKRLSGNIDADFLDFIHLNSIAEISIGILASIFIAFCVGAIVQFCSRAFFTFDYQSRLKSLGVFLGGLSLTAITYFILIKGLAGSELMRVDFSQTIHEHGLIILLLSFVFWTSFSWLYIRFFKKNVLKLIIVSGTFALALAFAGNDLVNFIGVSVAAFQSFALWKHAFLETGVLPSEFLMTGLTKEVQTPLLILFVAGIVMVMVLWFSNKAHYVLQTGIDLGRQGEGHERFKPTRLSRKIVRYALFVGQTFSHLLSDSFQKKLSKPFDKTKQNNNQHSSAKPAFDKLRAAINLVLASVLISIGTNFKLPLSTTYITFMVAMGTSFGDRAWDRDSAVYRVAGVVKVIGSWALTAFIAFLTAAIMAMMLWFGSYGMLILLVILAFGFIIWNSIKNKKRQEREEEQKRYNKVDILTISEMTSVSSEYIIDVIEANNVLLREVINNLGYHDASRFKATLKKRVQQEQRIERMRANMISSVKTIEESALEASRFYIAVIGSLEAIVVGMSKITTQAHGHVDNNYKNLKFSQIKALKRIDEKFNRANARLIAVFQAEDFEEIDVAVADFQRLKENISSEINRQILRIKQEENNPKHTELYFGLLLELKDLTKSTLKMTLRFQSYHNEARLDF